MAAALGSVCLFAGGASSARFTAIAKDGDLVRIGEPNRQCSPLKRAPACRPLVPAHNHFALRDSVPCRLAGYL